MKLVIVESPTKAKTIGRFLGSDYTIKASMGHVMDLPKSTLGVDIEHNFTPQYEIMNEKKKTISELKTAAKNSEAVILATDPDREGEAIAAHVAEILPIHTNTTNKSIQRIVFHEITQEAINDALKNPRLIDVNLVNAQTARRVLDRLVGYKLSPLLWQKVRRGLSAGRVQSVALRIIVEREREIEKFKKEPYYTVHAVLAGIKGTKESEETQGTEFELIEINGQKIEQQEKFKLYDGEYTVSKTTIVTLQKAKEIVADLSSKQFTVSDVLQKETKRSPGPAYTTSTLQQDASRRLSMPGKRTMSLAQKLYEEGYITYHRTDSVVLSHSAQGQIIGYIKKEFGQNYVQPRNYKTKQKLAQEAHEAIRPTKIGIQSLEIRSGMGEQYAKLYDLIWRRAVATQMSDAVIESTTVIVDADEYRLKANGSVLVFDGFLKINPQALQDNRLPQFSACDQLNLVKAWDVFHKTTPPPRYNEASLIKSLEEAGIGRPSTYATIISTIESRQYIEREEQKFKPTAIGTAVNDFLVMHFSDIDDIPFTATMEQFLDDIASGEKEWIGVMKGFYKPFSQKLESVKSSARVQIKAEETSEICEKCGSSMVIRIGRFGKFLSCSKFPDCDFKKPFIEKTQFVCPKDGGTIIVKKTKRGRKFYGCSNYPACKFAVWNIRDLKNPQVRA